MAGFEEQLRQALHARAGQIRPDPDRRDELARRIRRRRVLSYAGPAVAAAAVIAAAVLVVPALVPSTTEVELDPGEPAPEVAEEPAEADPAEEGDAAGQAGTLDEPGAGEGRGSPPADQLAPLDAVEGLRQRIPRLSVLTGDRYVLLGQRILPQELGDGGAAGPIAVSPQADATAPVVAFLQLGEDGQAGSCQAQLRLSGPADPDAGTAEQVSVAVDAASCPGTPAISPSGRRVAWIEDGTRLTVVEIERALADDGRAETTSWELDAGGAVDLRGWLSTPEHWELILAEETDGADQLHRLPIERQGDGALALPPGGQVLDGSTAVPRERLTPLALGTIEPQQPRIAEVDLLGLDEANQAFVRRGAIGSEGTVDFALGPDVGQALFDDEALEGVANPWLTSRGRDVLLGDGRGRVWHVHLPETTGGSPEVTELDADWTGAAILPATDDTGG